MGASLTRLRTKPEREGDADADQMRLILDRRPDLLPERLTTHVITKLDQREASAKGWTFVMLSPADNAKVVSWLAANSTRPMVAMQLWAELFCRLRRDTGEIAATRDELAESISITPREVSTIMGELESINAISRDRVKVAGMRGPGVVRYRMNSHVATHLGGAARDKAQAQDGPLLKLIDGGRP